MLITNFASGELSETLFGRTDLPQYYQGVSRLENFDVIPTGGIRRRNGTKRILEMRDDDGNPLEGRIIPFIVDRESSFLLYLTPGAIRAFKTDGNALPVTVGEGVELYPAGDIQDVQYAQNYDTMILVHEDKAPLSIIVFDTDNGKALQVLRINIDVMVQIKKSGSENDKKYYSPVKFDEQYKTYLSIPGNYPRTVTFLNDRLIFAGTKNNPQRIFASAVLADENKQNINNRKYNFATYTFFLTFVRTYISVYGKFDVSANTFTLDDPKELGKFTENYDKYYVSSLFFKEGIMVAGITSGVMQFTEPSDGVDIGEGQLELFLVWKTGKEAGDKWSEEYITYSTNDTGGRLVQEQSVRVSYRIGKFKLSNYSGGTIAYGPIEYDLPGEQIRDMLLDFSVFDSFVRNIITYGTRPGEISRFIADFYAYIRDTMKYPDSPSPEFPYTFYGTPAEIYQQILGGNTETGGEAIDTYMSFYTVNVIEEEYPVPSDGFTFEIASDMSDTIKWIGQNKSLLVGTETAEWVIPAGVNATNTQAVLNSRYGSDRIQGTAVGDAFCFFQTGRKALVEYYIPQQDNNFRANNMALLSPGMLHESPAFDFDFVSAPYTRLFVSREDGKAAVLLYERGTGTFAWGRIVTGGGGKVKSIATIPGEEGYDEVYLIVERDGAFFLERLDERGRVYLDSNRPWTGSGEDWEEYDNASAVVYDETAGRTYRLNEAAIPPVPGDFEPAHTMYIGYPFVSRVRSMPVLANDRMKQNNIKALKARFRDSFMPRVRSEPNNVENSIPHRGMPGEGFSGVADIPFPGVYDRDVFFEFVFSEPRRCEILAVNAEVN
jgi:hypothetical protein